MTPTHAIKKGVCYRYYLSARLIRDVKANAAREKGGQSERREPGQRLPANDLEQQVIGRFKTFFADASAVTDVLPPTLRSAPNVKRAVASASRFLAILESQEDGKTMGLLRALLSRTQVRADRIDIELSADRVLESLLSGAVSTEDQIGIRNDTDASDEASVSTDAERQIHLTISTQLQRVGKEMRVRRQRRRGRCAA